MSHNRSHSIILSGKYVEALAAFSEACPLCLHGGPLQSMSVGMARACREEMMEDRIGRRNAQRVHTFARTIATPIQLSRSKAKNSRVGGTSGAGRGARKELGSPCKDMHEGAHSFDKDQNTTTVARNNPTESLSCL